MPRPLSRPKPSRNRGSAKRLGRRVGVCVADHVAGVPCGRMADAAEPALAGLDVGFQHRLDIGPEHEVGEADDGADARRLGRALGGLGGHPGDELGLAHRPQGFGSFRAVFGGAIDEHGQLDGMAAARIGPQIGQQVGRIEVPEVMVRIDHRALGLDGLLDHLGEPCGAAGHRLASLPSGSPARGRYPGSGFRTPPPSPRCSR